MLVPLAGDHMASSTGAVNKNFMEESTRKAKIKGGAWKDSQRS